MSTVLCVDDEAMALSLLEHTIEGAGHRFIGVRNIQAALTVLRRGGVDLVVADYRMPEGTGLELLATMEKEELAIPLIMVTGHASIEHAVAAIKAGAIDYITKPVHGPQLTFAVEQALELSRLRSENARLKQEVNALRQEREIVGESSSLSRVMETVRMVAPARAAILLQGESGTGKELVARAIHAMSGREGPFVSINCAALPDSLVESTLFGHEKGAFTGAVKQVKGAFERAHRGTLLLDEISEMRVDLQSKLLRVLQEQEFERVGGTAPIRVDVRIVATTNRDLAQEVSGGAFREDLYFRLSVVPILIPPLRDRTEDIPLLVHHFARLAARELGRTPPRIPAETIEALVRYPWPGNIRELSHAVERAVLLSPGEDLPPEAFQRAAFGLTPTPQSIFRSGGGAPPPEEEEPSANGIRIVLTDLNIARAEEILIERALEATGQNRTRAADLLGISVRTLRTRLNQPD
jgi:DNA-binding NtrC family response regulator